MHYYQFNIGDYRKDTQHLSPIEHYIYRQLIDSYYLDERPIPKETQPLLRRLSLGYEHEKDIQNVLQDFFVFDADGDVWRHIRIDHDISEYRAMAEKNARNGKKGGRPKKEKPKKTQSVSSGNPGESQKKPNQEPLTNNQEPLTNGKDKSPAAPVDFSVFNLPDEFIEEIKRIRVANKGGAIKTQRVANGLAKEINLAMSYGFGLDDILTEWETRKWKSFKAEWMSNSGVSHGQQPTGSKKSLSASERVRQAISEKQAARSAAGGPGGDFGGQVMADAGGHVRTQAGEPVRGDPAGCVGEVLEGDFWPANSGRS